MINVGIVGAAGYSGAELIRILLTHPEANLSIVTSRQYSQEPVDTVFPHFRQQRKLYFSDPDEAELEHCDVVFFATPHGVAMKQVPELLKADVKVIDLSADFRIKDIEVWERYYGVRHACPELINDAVYGLPEVNRSVIEQADLVANPGCYPTAITLGFLPLVEQGWVEPDSLIADAKSGVSGAGRQANIGSHFCEVQDSLSAYKVKAHRHWPEIHQTLSLLSSHTVDLTFVPHLVPMSRGIHATLYAQLGVDAEDLQSIFDERYSNEPFVDVLPINSHPKTKSVQGTNMCQIAVHRPQRGSKVVILSVIDNLVKGAAGQAIQNMNIMFGFPETMGLHAIAQSP